MKLTITLQMLLCITVIVASAQVKSSYQYSTTMPYGTLDIRTKISTTNYYYLQEGKTFSFRESSPGVKTGTYKDMTSWDSSPYKQGNMRQKNGEADLFKMNYRLLMPLNYSTTYAEGYPLIVLLHGGGERANCFYNTCYHSNWSYDPNVNSPAAPTLVDHKLLNNDHNVNIGGKQHLDARSLAGTRLPNDPTMPARGFPGFVLIPQMMNVWDSLVVEDMIRLVRLHCQKYKIDQNRIYIHGLSIGGYAVYEAMKRAGWLFAAALPMSAVKDGNIFLHNQQSKVVQIPLWVFQGGTDTNPSPTVTKSLVTKFKSAGAIVRYSEYPTLGHSVWNTAYAEPDFFSWMLSKNKANIHPSKGNTVIVRTKNIFPKLMLAQGFLAYQWEKDGVIISTATSYTYSATAAGVYRARFSRVSTAPTMESQWNRWSQPMTIMEGTAVSTASTDEEFAVVEELQMGAEVSVYPNPSSGSKINLFVPGVPSERMQVSVIDALGRTMYQVSRPFETEDNELPISPSLADGVYMLRIDDGKSTHVQRLIIKN
jgi:hypothetical protein